MTILDYLMQDGAFMASLLIFLLLVVGVLVFTSRIARESAERTMSYGEQLYLRRLRLEEYRRHAESASQRY